ncbi:hypothetical protein L600_001000000270 [Isoptericola variabilis J7]|nr:hypothetical protein L600_001000000270 [Isoptericola variabilis J7]
MAPWSSARVIDAGVNRTVRAAPRDSASAVRSSSRASAIDGRPGTIPVRSPWSRISSTSGGSTARSASSSPVSEAWWALAHWLSDTRER